MYNNGNDRTNGADEIMRRLMDITSRNMTDDMYDYDMNNGFRSIHGTPEGTEEDGMWSVPTISQQRPQRPSNGNNGNNGQMRPPMQENRPSQRPENRPPMQENRPSQRPENRPPMQENRPPQRPQPPRPQPPRPEPPRPQPPMQENRPQRPERPESPRPQRPPCGKRPGYAHIVRHDFEDMYDPSTSLKRGTMFRVLDLPKNVYEMKEED